jgi:hypothetical protein
MTSSSHEMTDTQALAAVLAAHATARAGDHPELDQLAGYLAGSLAPEVEASIQDHLVACRACTAQLLDLESLSPTGPRVAEGVADLALEAGWREQKTRIADLETARRRQRSLRWVSAVAAAFFVATVGLSVHVGQLRQRLAPEINSPIAYLDSAATRDSAGAVTVELAPGDRSVLLALTPPSSPEWPDYEVEILTASGSEVWSGRGFVLSDSGTLRLRMPRSLLPAGGYEVRLNGVEGDRIEPLQVIELLVRDK